MIYTTLPNTDIKVSKICLGTMTWGNQNSKSDSFKQMDYALDRGVNFFDTAELYPVPASKETQGLTSRYIGEWLNKRQLRDKVVLASKIAGPGDYTKHIRTTGFSKKSINEAVNLELKRLKTDYIDLYQLHWPERLTNTFGIRDFKIISKDQWKDNFSEILYELNKLVDNGKIRTYGLSNEKSWGAMRYIEEIRKNRLKKMSTIQNAYSLINRVFEGDLAEISYREKIGLLAYSPLAFGVLSGKYIEGKASKKARLNLFPRFKRYSSEEALKATKAYLDLSKDIGISLTTMALAFVNQREFVTSNIIGATSLSQLKENIDSIDIKISKDVISRINCIHSEIPNPSP